MKTLITTILMTTASLLIGSNVPESIIESDEVYVISNSGELDLFSSASYNSENNKIIFNTKTQVNIIQIFNENGELEFQLPVMSKNVTISKTLFSIGESQLGFVMEGEAEVQFTTITIKE